MTKDGEDDFHLSLTLGDISHADDRVKKFFGILPKDSTKEIKTVRMVKRDSKERSISKSGNNYEAEDESHVIIMLVLLQKKCKNN